MSTYTLSAEDVTLRPPAGPVRVPGGTTDVRDAEIQPLAVAVVAETAEAVIEELDAPLAAAPWLGHTVDDEPAIAVDEYAKAVLYNGLGHYQAARTAAARACERGDFSLLEGALAELIEASVRSGDRAGAVLALRRLDARATTTGSAWALGVAATCRALLCDDDAAESDFLEGIERLRRAGTCVALGRAQLLYGEWLRRRGRRVDAREQLSSSTTTFTEVGLGDFAERARRELLATGETVRRRTDDTRLDLTPQESEIARFAATGSTNAEIGEQLYLSPRTVEWHLRKVYTKLGVSSRRELRGEFAG